MEVGGVAGAADHRRAWLVPRSAERERLLGARTLTPSRSNRATARTAAGPFQRSRYATDPSPSTAPAGVERCARRSSRRVDAASDTAVTGTPQRDPSGHAVTS